jgi:hypothetical protein
MPLPQSEFYTGSPIKVSCLSPGARVSTSLSGDQMLKSSLKKWADLFLELYTKIHHIQPDARFLMKDFRDKNLVWPRLSPECIDF